MKEKKIVSVRLPAPLVNRVDRLMNTQTMVEVYGTFTRTDVIKTALLKGLTLLEKEERESARHETEPTRKGA